MAKSRKVIPFTRSCLGSKEIRSIARVLSSGWLVQGPRVAEFEKIFSEYVGARYAVATSSCTTALHLALLIKGIGRGDEVICPSYTFVATANAILYTGATPLLIDINPLSFNMDPTSVEAAITPKTKAILPVHQLGLPAEMDEINCIARKHRLTIVEDAACAIGARYKGRVVGSGNNISCFSFHPRKVITTGEGGMLTLPRKAPAERAVRLRTHGASVYAYARHKAKTPVFETYAELGYNYRMTDIQAAIGIEQMKKVDLLLNKRLILAKRYNRALGDTADIELPIYPSHLKGTYQTYAIRLKHALAGKRDRLLASLAAHGISARRGIPPIHLQPYWIERFGKMPLPATEEVSRTSIFLPLYPAMTKRDQDFVIGKLIESVRRLR